MTKIVLGGGLSGLSAAYYLLKRFPNEKVLLVEKGSRTGGWVCSHRSRTGAIFEAGPRTIRPRGAAASNTLQLIEELDLENDILPIKSNHPAAKNRMVYVNGKLHKLPSSIHSLFWKTAPFSKPIAFSLLKDIWTPRKISAINDESIYDFVCRRFGDEIADYIISPMICGVCAGNSKEISVHFLMESLFNYEQLYGSITKGLIKSFSSSKSGTPAIMKSELLSKALREHWSIYSFKNGIETLTRKLAEFLKGNGVEFMLNEKCKNIEFTNDKLILHTDKNTYNGEHVFCCIPSKNTSSLIQNQHLPLSELLKQIPTVDVVVLNLEFKGNLLKEPAFGYLIPPKEEVPILGVIFDSCCKSQIQENTLVTVMLGGYWFTKYLGANPNETDLLNMSLDHLKTTLHISNKPIDFKINILRECIPQYVVGHKKRLIDIHEYIKTRKMPLSFCGASYHGVGVNDVILSAKNAVYNL